MFPILIVLFSLAVVKCNKQHIKVEFSFLFRKRVWAALNGDKKSSKPTVANNRSRHRKSRKPLSPKASVGLTIARNESMFSRAATKLLKIVLKSRAPNTNATSKHHPIKRTNFCVVLAAAVPLAPTATHMDNLFRIAMAVMRSCATRKFTKHVLRRRRPKQSLVFPLTRANSFAPSTCIRPKPNLKPVPNPIRNPIPIPFSIPIAIHRSNPWPNASHCFSRHRCTKTKPNKSRTCPS